MRYSFKMQQTNAKHTGTFQSIELSSFDKIKSVRASRMSEYVWQLQRNQLQTVSTSHGEGNTDPQAIYSDVAERGEETKTKITWTERM